MNNIISHPFLIPRTMPHITSPLMQPPLAHAPMSPTRINLYNPVTGQVNASFSNFTQDPMEQHVTEEYVNVDCKVTLSGTKKSVELVKKILNASLTGTRNPYLITDNEVELDSNMK